MTLNIKPHFPIMHSSMHFGQRTNKISRKNLLSDIGGQALFPTYSWGATNLLQSFDNDSAQA
jgi:hypothetical protein